ncbi:YhcN/YlaJ family sporulation lipoprotein [Lederbergia citrea]|uniref:YhcN/YlaJ family sporulation lipoprotein n=1 Tax=Lederbergia citrea TaxID=2833581 RepID=A0A942Z3P4_9BACI|nr:YhcN/YlaJ family sporulation lipoprotein [Lederbergia citrea]
MLCVGLVSVMLMGCGTTNRGNLATDNNNNNRPMGVRYNPEDNRDFGRTNNMTGYYDNRAGTLNNRDGFGTNVGTNTGNGTNDHNAQIDVADDIADNVATLNEVDRAHVLVTNRNAYVAVKLNSSARNELTKHLERRIADKVRDVDANLDHVYVSENPDFYDRMHGYRNDIRSGRPVSGFFNDFTTTVQRIFPTAR